MTIKIINHTAQSVDIANFDKERYVDSGVMHQEAENIWRNTWLLAGLESDLAEAGDFFVFDIGVEQILIVRSQSRAVQAFYNVCQHRGNRLVTDERGCAATFRCAYHAWTYNLDGDLDIVPYAERFAGGVPRDDLGLAKVHLEIWSGFVFVHLGEQPEPLLEFLGPVADMLAPYRFDKMVLVEDQTVHLSCNWKAVVDNFSELYHVDFLHPQHKRMVDCCNDTVHLFDHGHTGLAVPGATVNPRFPVPNEPTDIQAAQLRSLDLNPQEFTGRVLDVREAVQARKREIGRSRGFHYDALADDQLSDVWQFNVFPNTIFSFTPEHVWVLRPRPHATDPNRCEFDKLSLVMFADPDLVEDAVEILGPGRSSVSRDGLLPDDYQRPERDVFHYDAVLDGTKSMTDTIDQDVELLGNVQAGMRSAGFRRTFLNDDEMRIQHFHNELERKLSSR